MRSTLEIQKALLRKGFNPGPLDGVSGPKTEAAIVAFKQSIGHVARPYLGPLTLAALFDDRVDRTGDGARPPWLRVALSYLGLQEYPGSRHNPTILEWWSRIRAPFTDDETPWCAAFVGGVLEECGILSSRSAAARSYVSWGTPSEPAVGAIVSFWRGSPSSWSGHVGFVIGKDQRGNLQVLGGNQGNAVTIKPFDVRRILSFRWPAAMPPPASSGWDALPRVQSDGRLSTDES